MPKKIIYWDITIPNSMGPGYDIIASFAKKQHAQRASLGKHDYGQNANVREQKLILFPSLEEYKEVLKKKGSNRGRNYGKCMESTPCRQKFKRLNRIGTRNFRFGGAK